MKQTKSNFRLSRARESSKRNIKSIYGFTWEFKEDRYPFCE